MYLYMNNNIVYKIVYNSDSNLSGGADAAEVGQVVPAPQNNNEVRLQRRDHFKRQFPGGVNIISNDRERQILDETEVNVDFRQHLSNLIDLHYEHEINYELSYEERKLARSSKNFLKDNMMMLFSKLREIIDHKIAHQDSPITNIVLIDWLNVKQPMIRAGFRATRFYELLFQNFPNCLPISVTGSEQTADDRPDVEHERAIILKTWEPNIETAYIKMITNYRPIRHSETLTEEIISNITRCNIKLQNLFYPHKRVRDFYKAELDDVVFVAIGTYLRRMYDQLNITLITADNTSWLIGPSQINPRPETINSDRISEKNAQLGRYISIQEIQEINAHHQEEAPAEAPVEAQVEAHTEAPVEAQVEAHTEAPVEAQVEAHTEVPAEARRAEQSRLAIEYALEHNLNDNRW